MTLAKTIRSALENLLIEEPHALVKLDSPYLNNDEAAVFCNCSPHTLRISRKTGLLFGKPTPKFLKRGRNILYTRDWLIEFHEQFEEQTNTAPQRHTQLNG